jgi:hypothetical protein
MRRLMQPRERRKHSLGVAFREAPRTVCGGATPQTTRPGARGRERYGIDSGTPVKVSLSVLNRGLPPLFFPRFFEEVPR